MVSVWDVCHISKGMRVWPGDPESALQKIGLLMFFQILPRFNAGLFLFTDAGMNAVLLHETFDLVHCEMISGHVIHHHIDLPDTFTESSVFHYLLNDLNIFVILFIPHLLGYAITVIAKDRIIR